MRDRILATAAVFTIAIALAAPAGAQRAPEVAIQQTFIDIDVVNKPLAMVVESIRQATGKNIVLGSDKDNKPIELNRELLVTIRLVGVHWELALKLVCEKAGAKVEILEGNVYRVYQPPEITLALENADVRVVVDMIARVSGKNIVIGSDVGEGKRVTLRVSNLPWLRALKTVVESVGLTVVEDSDGLVYRIADPATLKKELITEVIPLQYLTLPSDYVATIKNELVIGKTEAPSVQERIKNFTLINALKEVITRDLGRVDYDLTSNSLLITDTPTKIAEIKKIIVQIDKKPSMLQIDVKFLSSRRTDVMSVGVEWPNGPRIRTDGNTGLGSMYTRFPYNLGAGGWEDQMGISVDSTGSYFQRGPTTTDVSNFLGSNSAYSFGQISFREFQMILDYIKTDTESVVIQKPTLSVLDNHAATIFVGESVRYAEAQVNQTAAGGQTATITEGKNSPVEIGFQLLVKPHVIPESSKIKLLLIPTLRDLSGNSTTQPGFDTFSIGSQTIDLPRISASTVVTEMIVEDGQTAVIGGLVREVKSETVIKWPILGDIPLLGYLFKNIKTNREKRNVHLFVTVKIIREPQVAKQALAEQLRRRDVEIEREYWEDIRRETHQVTQPPAGEGSGQSGSGTSNPPPAPPTSFLDYLDKATSSDDQPEPEETRPARRRDSTRRW